MKGLVVLQGHVGLGQDHNGAPPVPKLLWILGFTEVVGFTDGRGRSPC